MIRLLLPLAGVVAFFLLSLITVRLLRPKQPRRFFLVYALSLLLLTALVYVRLWRLDALEASVGLVGCLLLQALMCLTLWNSFYSLL